MLSILKAFLFVCLTKWKGQKRISGVGCSSHITFWDVFCEGRTDTVQERVVICLYVLTRAC